MPAILSYQQPLRQRLPEVFGSVDYRRFRDTLQRMAEVIVCADLDRILILHWLEMAQEQGRKAAEEESKPYRGLSYKALQWIQKIARQTLRCGIARS